MDLSIILVNWNSEEYLRECIASIYEWTHQFPFEVIVVDNASPSGKVDTLKVQSPEIKLIKSAKNLGFAGANNLGFLHSTGDCVLFLNPDTKLNSPAIQIMMEEIRRLPRAGVVGCRLLNVDRSVQTSSIMKFPRIGNAILQVEYFRLRWPELWGIDALFTPDLSPTEVEAISGACMLMRREVFAQIGMFSEEYFMYSEDLDLCYQAVKVGFKNYHVGSATIVHYGGTSSAPAWQTAMKTRAQLWFCEKNYGSFYSLLFRLAMVINASVRLVLLVAMRFFAGMFGAKHTLDSAWLRWSIILKTLMSRNSAAARSAIPMAS
jgi:GT2 family glycosyltransferase